jgi:hypothetical protein
MGISLHRGPAWECGLIYQGLLKMDEGGLWKWSISVCGSCVRGTPGDPEGYVKEGPGNGCLLT